MHADRTNRTMLLLLAVLLIAAGLDAGAASIGAFGAATRHSLLIANPTGHFIGAQGDWLWPTAAVAALILALLAVAGSMLSVACGHAWLGGHAACRDCVRSLAGGRPGAARVL